MVPAYFKVKYSLLFRRNFSLKDKCAFSGV